MRKTLFLVVLISCILCDKSSGEKGAAAKLQKEERPLARNEKTIPIAFEKIEKSPRVWPDLQSTYENLFRERAPDIASNTELRIGDTGKAIHGIDWKRDTAWCFAGDSEPFIAAFIYEPLKMPLYRSFKGADYILRIENGLLQDGTYYNGIKSAELEFYETPDNGDYLVDKAIINSHYAVQLRNTAEPQMMTFRLEPIYPPDAGEAQAARYHLYVRVVFMFRLVIKEVYDPERPTCLARFNIVPADKVEDRDFSWEPKESKYIPPHNPYKPDYAKPGDKPN